MALTCKSIKLLSPKKEKQFFLLNHIKLYKLQCSQHEICPQKASIGTPHSIINRIMSIQL